MGQRGGLVSNNLLEPEARRLMLLTKSNAALGLLFDRHILVHDKTEVIFGSDFPWTRRTCKCASTSNASSCTWRRAALWSWCAASRSTSRFTTS